MKFFRCSWICLSLLLPRLVGAQSQPVTVSVASTKGSAEISPNFLGLSYESSMLLPKDGHYYFDAKDTALVNTFKTLGIRSLRVGANAVDDARIPIPDEHAIDALFNFARAADVKVIYSFRLKNGKPSESARLARYIADHDSDALDCFSIGNEPNFFAKPFDTFLEQWKPHYDAILQAVPNAMFDGPSADPNYAVRFAKAMFSGGHIAMVSDHYYFLGSGREGEKNPAANRERFLSNAQDATFQKDYNKCGAAMAHDGVPYRIDEMNSCYNGGAKDSSDTYASALWSLDCTHWWATRHILGVNYHTGELVGRDGKFGPPNYASFIHQPGGAGFIMRPLAYAHLAFTQAAHGHSLPVSVEGAGDFNFTAYGFQDGQSIYLTLINKSHGGSARKASVSIQLPQDASVVAWRRLDLMQKDGDIAAKSDITFGGAAIDSQGNWTGAWAAMAGIKPGGLTIEVAPTTATVLCISVN